MLKYFICVGQKQPLGADEELELSDRQGLDEGAVELADMAVQVS